MESYQIFLIMLAVYLAALVSIGWYFTKRQKSITDFWLAGRNIGSIGVGFSAAASWLTAGALLSVIGLYLLNGMGSIWGFVVPNILALLIIAILVSRIKHLPAITQPELLEQRYSSAIRAPVAAIITIVMILFAVADIKGFALVLEVFFGLSPVYAAAIVAIAVSIYVTLGGLSAVVWTDVLQFTFLSLFVISMAVITVGAASSGAFEASSAMTVSDIFGNVNSSWWNPFSVGIPFALIFLIAIIPGWITEQDPWQRVWAAKDRKSARFGMTLGAFLITVVFAACAVIALGLNSLYPGIAEAGFPAGMARAETALLQFINSSFSTFVVGLSAIGLAAAAMSCTDTFATSGASCVSRDIYQRFIKPDATMKQMRVVNRISVLFIVASATIISFYITSILDAIHIATYIASASYFFPLMGGIYWKRATKEGAIAGLIVGAIAQITLTVIDLANTGSMAQPYLQTIHPILRSHGVIVGMLLSAVAFFGVSIATQKSSNINLAPFFKESAKELSTYYSKEIDESDPEYNKFLNRIDEKVVGERGHLHLNIETSATINWGKFVNQLKSSYPAWVTSTGYDSVYRLTHADMLQCISITRGNTENEIWFASEPEVEYIDTQRKELYVAYNEVADALHRMGITAK